MENTQQKLQLIREGVTYEYDKDYVAESDGLVLTAVLALALGGMGALHYYANKLQYKVDPEYRAAVDKKKADKNASSERAARREEFLKKTPINTLESKIKDDIKKVVQKFKTDTKIKERVDRSLKDSKDKKYSLLYKDEGDYIEIVSGSQDVKISLHWIVSNIVRAIEIKYAEPLHLGLFKISSGDGDEGSIYLEMKG